MTGAHIPQDCLYFHLFLVIVLLLFFCFSSFQSKSHLSQTLCCFAVRSSLPIEPGRCEYERSPCLCLSIFQCAGRLPSWFLLGCCGRLGKAEAAAGRPRPCTARAITHSMDAFPFRTVWPSHPAFAVLKPLQSIRGVYLMLGGLQANIDCFTRCLCRTLHSSDWWHAHPFGCGVTFMYFRPHCCLKRNAYRTTTD